MMDRTLRFLLLSIPDSVASHISSYIDFELRHANYDICIGNYNKRNLHRLTKMKDIFLPIFESLWIISFKPRDTWGWMKNKDQDAAEKWIKMTNPFAIKFKADTENNVEEQRCVDILNHFVHDYLYYDKFGSYHITIYVNCYLCFDKTAENDEDDYWLQSFLPLFENYSQQLKPTKYVFNTGCFAWIHPNHPTIVEDYYSDEDDPDHLFHEPKKRKIICTSSNPDNSSNPP